MTVGTTAIALGLVVGTAPTPAKAERTAASYTHYVDNQRGTRGSITVDLKISGTMTVSIDGIHQGQQVQDTLEITSLTLIDEAGDYTATARSQRTGQDLAFSSTEATPQAVPALIVLGLLARVGLKAAMRQFTKTQIKKAAKSYLLNQVKADKWRHIMAPKHKWGTAGAKSREQVAELMSRAMAEGTHGVYQKTGRNAVWNHKGKTIEVTYSPVDGKISNGWVR